MSSPAWEELDALCRIPHRGSTTAGERRAADWIAERLERLGYAVSRQPFSAPRATLYTGASIVLLLVAASASAGLLVPAVPPSVTLLVALAASIPLVGEIIGARRVNFDLLLPKHPSQNVIGVQHEGHTPPSKAAVDESASPAGDEASKRIIVVAHYDTQLGSPLFSPRFVGGLTVFFVAAYAALAAIIVFLVVETIVAWTADVATWSFAWRTSGGPVGVRVVLSASATLCALWLLACRAMGRHVNGANDNGSGVALALALARRLAEEGPIPGARLTFAFTGAEEVGERGMRRFIECLPASSFQAPRSERPVVINLDNLGAGNMRYLTGEGMLRYYPYDPELVGAARRLADRHPEGSLSPCRNLPLPTDGLVSVTRGLPTITFVATTDDGRIPNYHWHTDRLEAVDAQLLAREANMLWEFLSDVATPADAPTGTTATPGNAPAPIDGGIAAE